MHLVFINYRTGDGDEAAALLEKYLSERFGSRMVFRAAKSIAPGEPYPQALLNAARRCAVLLAVMGAAWAQHPQLRDEADWVRREILEAYANGIPVVPVLKNRAGRLNARDLPTELERLADAQSLRLDIRDNETDLARIGDKLTDLVPSLLEADSTRRSPVQGAVQNSSGNVRGTVIQGRDLTGDTGTVIKGNHGPVHAGQGNIYQGSQHFSGDGATYVQGDNEGGISHSFGDSRRVEDNR
jgi:hypothetical protein